MFTVKLDVGYTIGSPARRPASGGRAARLTAANGWTVYDCTAKHYSRSCLHAAVRLMAPRPTPGQKQFKGFRTVEYRSKILTEKLKVRFS